MAANPQILIAPSILSADFSCLGQQVAEAAQGGADRIHVDIMDGDFVPNITFGPDVVQAIRRWTDIPFDLHMMVSEPGRFVGRFADAGADVITVHAEACTHLHRVIQLIKDTGRMAGVAISPATPIAAVEEVLADVDQVLVMTVNPGFGGQKFIPSMVDKIKRMRGLLDDRGLSPDLEVDGGISTETAGTVVAAGATVLVAGSTVYNKESSVAEAIKAIRDSI